MNNLFFYHELHPRTMRQKQESTQPKMTNGPSDLFSIPGDEVAELVWENGQIVMQNQSSRFRKSSWPSSVFSSRHCGVQEKDNRGSANTKFAQSSELDDFAPSRHSPPNGPNTDEDDNVPWINYPIDEVLATETLQNDYCAEFLNEFSAFEANLLSAHKNATASSRNIGSALEVKNANNVEPEHASKESPIGCSEPGRTRASRSFQLPQQCQSAVPNSKSTEIDASAVVRNNVAQEGRCGDIPDRRLQNQGMSSTKQLQQPSPVAGWMNFSHFARPAALAKVGLKNAGGLKSIGKVTTPTSINPISSAQISSANGIKDVTRISGQSSSAAHKLGLESALKAPQGGCSVEHSNTICSDDALKTNDRTESYDNDLPSSSFAASAVLCRHNVSKDFETVVASSSMCSGNNTEAAPSEPKHAEKRKEYDGEDSDYHSEDLQDESVGIRKPPSGRGVRTKRSRAAEVHNLSERRRRNRINEKMRALQELIPNCNKVDKASMLEEAIEYLKTLQLQVQIMSMGSGLYVPPMMLPPALQHMRTPAMAHFPPVGIGMGTGIGLASGCPMIPIPQMHATQFSCALSSVQSVLNSIPGPVNPPIYGVRGQGIPILMPRPPQFSSMVGLSMNTSPVPEAQADAAAEVAGEQKQQNSNTEQNTSTEETQVSDSEPKSAYDDCIGSK